MSKYLHPLYYIYTCKIILNCFHPNHVLFQSCLQKPFLKYSVCTNDWGMAGYVGCMHFEKNYVNVYACSYFINLHYLLIAHELIELAEVELRCYFIDIVCSIHVTIRKPVNQ